MFSTFSISSNDIDKYSANLNAILKKNDNEIIALFMEISYINSKDANVDEFITSDYFQNMLNTMEFKEN